MNAAIRVAAAGIVVLGGGYIGSLAASVFSVRAAQLEQLCLVLTQISFNIGFLKLPVAQAVLGAAKSRGGTVSRMFLDAADEMKDVSPSVAFERSLRRNRGSLCLSAEDMEILRSFSENLGAGDTESEIDNIKAACAKLKLAQDIAAAERDRRGRLWRGVGFLGGMFAAVMLF